MIDGSLAARDEIDRAMRTALGQAQGPVTGIEGVSCDGGPLAGLQAFAVSGCAVTRVRLGNRIVGSVYEDEGARHCLLGGLGPTARTLGAGAQVQQTFGNLEWALDQAGFELGDVVRTWFHDEDILASYGEFNRVRSAHYATVKFRPGSLPASTGSGARNADGAALAVAAGAVRPIGEGVRAKAIGSPLQCPRRPTAARSAARWRSIPAVAGLGHREHPSRRENRLGGRPQETGRPDDGGDRRHLVVAEHGSPRCEARDRLLPRSVVPAFLQRVVRRTES
jgi:enamine deaminase RidA (YjgF/YER057c/UK114 family)